MKGIPFLLLALLFCYKPDPNVTRMFTENHEEVWKREYPQCWHFYQGYKDSKNIDDQLALVNEWRACKNGAPSVEEPKAQTAPTYQESLAQAESGGYKEVRLEDKDAEEDQEEIEADCEGIDTAHSDAIAEACDRDDQSEKCEEALQEWREAGMVVPCDPDRVPPL